MPAFLILDSISLNTPDGRPLFDGLTLALGRERTGLVGRNGSGKSTLLRLIAGQSEPSNGSVQRIGSIGMLAQLADERQTSSCIRPGDCGRCSCWKRGERV
jgi:ATPase subunit of ABC transporter with duplicated ATPase domains